MGLQVRTKGAAGLHGGTKGTGREGKSVTGKVSQTPLLSLRSAVFFNKHFNLLCAFS